MNDEAIMDHFTLDSRSLQAQKAARLARDLMEARAANTTAQEFANALADLLDEFFWAAEQREELLSRTGYLVAALSAFALDAFSEAVPMVLDEEEIGHPPFEGQERFLLLKTIQALRLNAEEKGVTI
jgi:hypothetical protein